MFDAYSIIEWFYSHYFQVVVCQVPFLTLECLQLQAISTRICSNPFIIFRWVTAVMPDSRSSAFKLQAAQKIEKCAYEGWKTSVLTSNRETKAKVLCKRTRQTSLNLLKDVHVHVSETQNLEAV
ncbi:unnamed protein product [Malus baccata var. baccata]